MRHIFLPLVVTMAVMLSAEARAGVTMVVQHGAASPSTVYVEGARLRAEMAERNGHATVVLIDAASKRQVMIDEKTKTYTEITEEDRKRLRGQMDLMRGQMAERMKNMPPAQRKQMEQALGSLGAPEAAGPRKPRDWKYEALGAKKTINGIACEMYRVSEDGRPREEVCVSPWSAGLVKKEDFAGLAKFGQEMMDEMGLDKNRQMNSAMFGRIDKAPGIPISRVHLEDDGTRGEEEQVKSIKRGPLPASLFTVPSGYTKKEMPTRPGPGARPHGPGAPPRE